ncbi:MAG: 2-oxoglutarate dehydrogenase complex dihydrolipoyllysine-residue succinyltransferase, partial [Chitinophagales bacterium]
MSKVEVKIPSVGESVTEVTVAKWLVEEGAYVEKDQVIVELESDKASMELPSEEAGTITFKVEEDSDVNVGDVIAIIDTSAKAPEKKEESKDEEKSKEKEADKSEEGKKESKTPSKEKSDSDSNAKGHAGPAAAKMMRENSISSKQIDGSGKGGRITKADVIDALKNGVTEIGGRSLATGGFSRDTNKEKMSKLRRTIAKRLVAAKNDTAMLTTFNEVDMSAVMELRNKYKEDFKEKHGIGLGFMSLFTKACCIALQNFPAVNGILEEDHVVYHDYCDIGIAVSTPKGLVVPVIRNAESLSLADIEKSVRELAIKGRDGVLTMDEMTGGTFTISNGGVFGSLMSTPILNAPQSAILGMHKIEDRPMAINGKVEIRPMMYLALSYDHRIIDGKESVSFLVNVKNLL